jgi:hypothetical protein
MIAHIRNGEIVRQYSSEKGWVELEDGSRMSPPVIGTYGNDKIVPVVEETKDTSTGSDIVTTDSGYQVEADRVYRLVTIRDMTLQEIADRDAALREKAINQIDREDALKAVARAIWHVHNGSVPTQVNTPAKFRQWLRQLMDQA